jgi:hypothetical protein
MGTVYNLQKRYLEEGLESALIGESHVPANHLSLAVKQKRVLLP